MAIGVSSVCQGEAAFAAGFAEAQQALVGTVVLSGGVFQNRRLLKLTATRLCTAGLRVLTPECLPPNDGGISFGQAVVAAARVQSLASYPGI